MSKDLEDYFRDEAQDLLLQINNALRTSPAQDPSTDVLAIVRRYVHTLKGSSHIAQRHDIAEKAHALEDLIDQVAIGNDPHEGIASIIRFTDRMAELLSQRLTDSPKQITTANSPDHGTDASKEAVTIHVELRQIDRILNQVAVCGDAVKQLRFCLSRCEDLEKRVDQLTRNQTTQTQRTALGQQQLHEFHDQISEVAFNLGTMADAFERDRQVLRRSVQDLRLVPARSIFIFVERAIRAAAEAMGRQVEFEGRGGEVELDADILFQVKDALVQIARNAVVHGVEDVTTRRNADKSAFGKVCLTVGRRGRRINFRASDDGAGIDPKKLRDHAVAHGWLSREAAEKTDDRELNSLILRPGFTTSADVNTIAGRGVGLDLVKHLVMRLKGEIRIESVLGRGTSIEIEVPSTLTSRPVLLAEVGSTVVGLPSDSVSGVHPLSGLQVLNGEYIVEGTAMPVLSLTSLLGIGQAPPRLGIRIAAQEQYLLGVDKVIGTEEVLIHQVPDFVDAEPYLLGLSTESSETLRLIIDPLVLGPESAGISRALFSDSSMPLPILIVDDSLTTRMLEQSILTTAGYKVELANSGEEALEIAARHVFSLFIVDVEMPGMDGFTFISRAHQSPGLRDVPAILVTSRDSDEDRERASEVGAKDFFSKATFDQKRLLKRVGELVGTK